MLKCWMRMGSCQVMQPCGGQQRAPVAVNSWLHHYTYSLAASVEFSTQCISLCRAGSCFFPSLIPGWSCVQKLPACSIIIIIISVFFAICTHTVEAAALAAACSHWHHLCAVNFHGTSFLWHSNLNLETNRPHQTICLYFEHYWTDLHPHQR